MATMQEIVEALGAAIATIDGIQSQGFMLPAPTAPYAQVYPGGEAGDINYDEAMGRGLDGCPFTVQVFSGAPLERTAQIKLLEYMAPEGDRSIKATLEADKTLGGLVDDLHVRSCSGYRRFASEHLSMPMLGATWHVDVMVTVN